MTQRAFTRTGLRAFITLLALVSFGWFLVVALAIRAWAAIPSTITLPATTTAYTAGQLMANSATGASVVVPQFQLSGITGPNSLIVRGHLTINDTTSTSWGGQTITVNLFSTAPTFANGDRSTYVVTTGTQAFIGTLTCTMAATVYTDGVYGECAVATGNAITITATAPTQVFWVPIATSGSGVTGASAVVSFTPEIVN